MEYLRRQLDDPAAAPCGRCDNCTQRRWSDGVTEAAARAAREHLSRPGTEIQPRKMWPTAMRELGVDVTGKIGAGIAAEPGRALGRLTDLGRGPRLRALLAGDLAAGDGVAGVRAAGDRVSGGRAAGDRVAGAAREGAAGLDRPVPADVVAAMVEVLAGWDWTRRPAAVVAMPSRTRPLLIASLASEIARIGRIPDLGSLGYSGPGRSGRQYNSAQRLRAVWDRIVVPAAIGAELARLDGPVLVVDDVIETGWTMTVAAMRLREAGASWVLPLALVAAAS
jgi:ATP-dependent DNA helicase RecQ